MIATFILARWNQSLFFSYILKNVGRELYTTSCIVFQASSMFWKLQTMQKIKIIKFHKNNLTLFAMGGGDLCSPQILLNYKQKLQTLWAWNFGRFPQILCSFRWQNIFLQKSPLFLGVAFLFALGMAISV